jgi:hypothetical protein
VFIYIYIYGCMLEFVAGKVGSLDWTLRTVSVIRARVCYANGAVDTADDDSRAHLEQQDTRCICICMCMLHILLLAREQMPCLLMP